MRQDLEYASSVVGLSFYKTNLLRVLPDTLKSLKPVKVVHATSVTLSLLLLYLSFMDFHGFFSNVGIHSDRLCGLVVRVLGYRSGGPGSIPGTTKEKSCGSGTGSTQPREYN
jgi:hypothetical protein